MKKINMIKRMGIGFLFMGVLLSGCGENAASEYAIPEGCTYTVASTGEVLESGERFPNEVSTGDIYYDFNAGYEYAYASSVQVDRVLTEDDGYFTHYFISTEDMNGWCVTVKDLEQEVYGELRSEIYGIPVVTIDNCFFGCENMKTAPILPDTIQSMKGAFGWCHSLSEMPVLPEGISDMSYAFEQCNSLTEISNIPSTVKKMSFAFADCKKLSEVGDIPDGVENMQGTFNGCSNLKTVGIIPESVKDLAYCFVGCSNLEGDLFIYANPEKYERCFLGTEKRIFVYGNENSNWMLLGKLCQTVESGQVGNVVMPG